MLQDLPSFRQLQHQVQQDQKEAVPLHVPVSAVRQATSSSLKENPSSSCCTWHGHTEKGTSGCADYTPRQNPLTCHSLGIYNVCSCFCHSRVHDVVAHSVHAARAQSSLLLAGSEGLNAQIHLHQTETHTEIPCAATQENTKPTAPSTATVSKKSLNSSRGKTHRCRMRWSVRSGRSLGW